MLNAPMGLIKSDCLLRGGQPPTAIDLDKGVCIQLDPITYQILAQYNRVKFNDILKGLREDYPWTAIDEAIFRLVGFAELGIIFTAPEGLIASKPTSHPHFVVSPGFIRNLQLRSVLSNAVYYALLSNFSQHADLSVFVPGSPNTSHGQREGSDDSIYPLLERIPYTSRFSYATVTELPLYCDAIVMFTPLHEDDLQFLNNCECPVLIFASDYDGSRAAFNNLSPAYSCLKDTDVWFCPHFWLEPQLRDVFPDLPHLYPLVLGVDSRMIRSLPEKTELKFSLSRALENDAFNANPAIGVFGNQGDWLASQLATNDVGRLYLCIAGTQRNPDLHSAFLIEDVEDVDVLPHVLKALDLLIFIAEGNAEPYVVSLAAALGIPIIVVCEDRLPVGLSFDGIYHCEHFDPVTIHQCVEEVLKSGTSPGTVDLESLSWDATSQRILQLHINANTAAAEIRSSVIPAPPVSRYLFAKFYDPAQKKLGTRCLSLSTFNDVPVEVGFARAMQQFHTVKETNIVLSHLGMDSSPGTES